MENFNSHLLFLKQLADRTNGPVNLFGFTGPLTFILSSEGFFQQRRRDNSSPKISTKRTITGT